MGEQAKWNVMIKKVSSCDFQLKISCLQIGCTMFIIIVAMTISIVFQESKKPFLQQCVGVTIHVEASVLHWLIMFLILLLFSFTLNLLN